MRKPVYAICEQQRHRSAYTSAQSHQHLCFCCLDSIIPLVSISKISSLYIASVAVEADLSVIWSEIPEDRFSHDVSQVVKPQCSNFVLFTTIFWVYEFSDFTVNDNNYMVV